MHRRHFLGCVPAVGLCACAAFPPSFGDSDAWRPLTDHQPRLDGAWESPSTGHAVVISKSGVENFHKLDAGWTADTGVVPPYALYRFDGDDLLLQHYDYRAFPQLLQSPAVFVRGPTPQDVRGITSALPQAQVFDLIWRTFDRYYAFFAERGVDWVDVRRTFAPQAERAQSDDALFDILVAALTPLGDGHVNLSQGERRFNAGRSSLRSRLSNAWRASGSQQTERDFVSSWSRSTREAAISVLDAGTHRTAAAEALEWGSIGSVGYLRINRFGAFGDANAPRPQQLRVLQAGLQQMDRDLAATSRLIVDVAHNGGGNDAAAMTAAAHFADRRRFVLEYRARGAAPQRISTEPTGKRDRKPILLLTSEITASAAESFVLMMRAFPHITHVGGRTRGILSSLLPKPFPNGFMATMAYQQVLDDQGRMFEAKGIPPVRDINLFPDADLSGGYAGAIRSLAAV